MNKYSIYILITLIFSFSSCSNIRKRQLNDSLQTLSFDEQLEVLKKIGYILKPKVTEKLLLEYINYEIEIQDPIDSIDQNPFVLLYYALAQQDATIQDYYLTDQHFYYVLDYFEQPIAYEIFMLRMGTITENEIHFENVRVEFDINNTKSISFKVNGLNKKWNLGEGNNVDDSFVQRFSYLTSELKTKGKYTYFDRGGEDFVIDYATEIEQTEFNKITGLNRIWLGEGNHFAEPTN